jgi:hypothetical protein
LKIAVDREAAVVELDADGALDIVTVSDSFNRGVMRTTY